MDAGLVKGRKVTSCPSLRKDLENAGVQWQDNEVVRDGHEAINGPAAQPHRDGMAMR